MAERLQKIISRAGVTSRRASEELILSGRVRVNGRIVSELGAKADPRSDTIEVDGKRLVSEPARYVVLHKPRNVVSTLSDPEGRPTVAELLRDAGARLYPVGRLDFATSGVLLATNDGDFANGLLHPRGGVPKTYVVKVRGLMEEGDLERWSQGVELEDGRTLPAEVRLLRHEDDKTWFEISIREGRNQQIRRMGEATGFPVMRLARISFAGITHEGLRPGELRSLTVEELEELRRAYGVPKRIRGAALGDQATTQARGARRPERRPLKAAAGDAARPERRPQKGSAGERGHGERRPSSQRDDDRAAPRRGPARSGAHPERGASTREGSRTRPSPERRPAPAPEGARSERRSPSGPSGAKAGRPPAGNRRRSRS